jgi:hypothetical protein
VCSLSGWLSSLRCLSGHCESHCILFYGACCCAALPTVVLQGGGPAPPSTTVVRVVCGYACLSSRARCCAGTVLAASTLVNGALVGHVCAIKNVPPGMPYMCYHPLPWSQHPVAPDARLASPCGTSGQRTAQPDTCVSACRSVTGPSSAEQPVGLAGGARPLPCAPVCTQDSRHVGCAVACRLWGSRQVCSTCCVRHVESLSQ